MTDQLEKEENQLFEERNERPHDQAEDIGKQQEKQDREPPAFKLRERNGQPIREQTDGDPPTIERR